MTRNEFDQIWNLLVAYYPTSAAAKNKNAPKAWFVALEMFEQQVIVEKVLDHVRRNKFFPDVADLTASLMPPPKKDNSWMKQYVSGKYSRSNCVQEPKDDSWMNDYM